MKKILSLWVFSILVLSTFTACGGSSNDGGNGNGNGNGNSNQALGDTSKDGTGTPADKKLAVLKDANGEAEYQLLAWNDLGMHCMDGKDYSVFSILPPYNNLNAQLVQRRNGNARLINSGVTLTYEAAPSLDGKKYNTSSSQKTNFWDFSKKLFGADLTADTGLKGNKVQSFTPQPLSYNSTHKWWEAEGIPTSPFNNDGTKNDYPMVRVTAKNAAGDILASTVTVLPVSDEMDCKKCHAANTNDEAKPSSGWITNADTEKEYKLNILKLHDDKHNIASKLAALQAKGYTYKSTLSETQASGTPILCAACHSSNALPGTGVAGVPPLTRALHSKHANVTDPTTNKRLNDSTNRDACYTCHPGSTTQCLRGAMGNAKNADGSLKMQCQSCHGDMGDVGMDNRSGWLDEPNCQVCHQSGQRYTSAFVAGTLRAVVDRRFATDANTPAQGKSLYRFSTGHQGMQCSACHGSTHAIYPSRLAEDNIQSKMIQGHEGTINDCTACHKTVPRTRSGGPHGMHTTADVWVRDHRSAARSNLNDCMACHGSDLRGSELSKMFSTKTRDGKTFQRGHKISCYDCHGKKW